MDRLHALGALILVIQNPPADSGELARAREELKRADEAVAKCEKNIVNVYRAFEDWILSIKDDPASPKIEAAAARAVEDVRKDLASGALPQDPNQRGKVVNEIRKKLFDYLAGVVPAGVRLAAAGRLANNLYSAATAPGSPAELIQKQAADVAAKWFDPNAPPHELWNRDLYKEVAAAKEYADARGAQAAAAERIARIEHPERFHPAFANTPEGMVFVMGGTYTLGPNDGYDIDTNKRKAAFQINLKSFYIDKTEVTNRQYYEFIKSLPKAEASARAPQGWEKGKDGYPVFPAGKEPYPVVGVGYEDAAAFAGSVRKRLPTEDEWEAAARGSKGNNYPWGTQYESKRANDQFGEIGGPAPVGSFPGDATPAGVLDLSGNVMEWTSTMEGGKTAAPKLETNTGIVIRGGAYDREPKKCSAVFRWIWAGSTKVGNLGFRCAKDAS